jgi:hypothetical protein
MNTNEEILEEALKAYEQARKEFENINSSASMMIFTPDNCTIDDPIKDHVFIRNGKDLCAIYNHVKKEFVPHADISSTKELFLNHIKFWQQEKSSEYPKYDFKNLLELRKYVEMMPNEHPLFELLCILNEKIFEIEKNSLQSYGPNTWRRPELFIMVLMESIKAKFKFNIDDMLERDYKIIDDTEIL